MSVFVLTLFGPLYVAGAARQAFTVYRWASPPWTAGVHFVAVGFGLGWPLMLVFLLYMTAAAKWAEVTGAGEQS